MTDAPAKPVPAIDPDSSAYWAALAEERLILKTCADCGKAHFYPRELCPHCHSDKVSWMEASGLGEVYSYTICHRPAGPAFAGETPYVVAIIALDEGPRMMSRIAGDPTAITIGQRVKVRFERQSDDLTLPMFDALQ